MDKIFAGFVTFMGLFALWSTFLTYQSTHHVLSRGVIGSGILTVVLLVLGVMALLPSKSHH